MKIFFVFLSLLSLLNPFSPNALAMGRRPAEQEPRVAAEGTETALLTLHDCYELSLEQSEIIAIRKEEIEVAEAKMFKAAGDALGDVDFVISNTQQAEQEGRTISSGDSVARSLAARERRERKFTINQPLFQGFKSIGALAGSGSLKKQRSEERRRATELLFLDVVGAFYGLLMNQKDVEMLERIHGLFKERMTDLEEREKIGRSRSSEVATARARMKQLEAELAGARGDLRIARHLLEFLTGIEMTPGQLLEEDLPDPRTQVLDISLETVGESAKERPDVEAARQAVKTAKQGIVVAQSGLWPLITFESNLYDKREGSQAGIDWDVLFKIDVPLFRGGETAGEIKEAVSEWKKAKYSHSLAEREAELEIKQSYEEWVSSLLETKALEEAVSASEENFRFQKEDYERNLVSNLDVLEALESLQETRREAIRAHYEMKENYWQLAVATGKFGTGEAA